MCYSRKKKQFECVPYGSFSEKWPDLQFRMSHVVNMIAFITVDTYHLGITPMDRPDHKKTNDIWFMGVPVINFYPRPH